MFCMLLYVVAYHNVAYHYVFLYLKITHNCTKIRDTAIRNYCYNIFISKLFRITHIMHS